MNAVVRSLNGEVAFSDFVLGARSLVKWKDRGLGMFDDDVDLLLSALLYLMSED